MKSYTDEELLAELCAADRKAYLFLYSRYKNGLFRYCLRLVRDRVLAEDAVQRTFAAVYTKCSSVRDAATLRSWIYTVARNEAFGVLRECGPLKSRTVWMGETDGEHEAVELAAPEATALEQIEREETSTRVRCAIDLLPLAYQEALLLREYDGLSYDEIARITHQSLSAVKSKLFKARHALMKKLEAVLDERSVQ